MKRTFDAAVAAVALTLLAPLLATLAALIRWRLGRPVLFSQERPGLRGEVFTLYKFRTMTDDRDDAGRLLPNEQRMTRFGRALRASSLDELPELWNVLRGDMSLVGPRPLLVDYLVLYTAEQARRHEVRPGLTGLTQVSGRNDLPWNERLALDVQYVDQRSMRLDLRILLRTVAVAFKGGRAAADTSHRFGGDGPIAH